MMKDNLFKRKAHNNFHRNEVLFSTIAKAQESSKSDSGWSRYHMNTKISINGLDL